MTNKTTLLQKAVDGARRIIKPMTKEEEYRNADVPMPEDEFKKVKEAADNEEEYQGGGAYRAFLELFYKNKKGKDE